MVGNILVSGAEGSQVVYPVEQEAVGGLLSAPPTAGPGDRVAVAFENCGIEPLGGPEIQVQLYLTDGARPYFARWDVNWPGGPVQDRP
jgi:hypothetical protein